MASAMRHYTAIQKSSLCLPSLSLPSVKITHPPSSPSGGRRMRHVASEEQDEALRLHERLEARIVADELEVWIAAHPIQRRLFFLQRFIEQR